MKKSKKSKTKEDNYYGSTTYRNIGYFLFVLEILLTIFFVILLILVTIIAPKEGLLDLVLTIIHSTLFVLVMEIRGETEKDHTGGDKDFYEKRLPRRIVFVISVLLLDLAVLMKHIRANDFPEPAFDHPIYIAILTSSIMATFNSVVASVWVLSSYMLRKVRSRE